MCLWASFKKKYKKPFLHPLNQRRKESHPDPDPLVRGTESDPHQNVTDPQHCSQDYVQKPQTRLYTHEFSSGLFVLYPSAPWYRQMLPLWYGHSAPLCSPARLPGARRPYFNIDDQLSVSEWLHVVGFGKGKSSPRVQVVHTELMHHHAHAQCMHHVHAHCMHHEQTKQRDGRSW